MPSTDEPDARLLRFHTAPPARICIIRLSAIGDTCHTLPVVRTLQRAWPKTRITWIIGKVESRLLGDVEGVDFIIFDKARGYGAYRELRKSLNNQRFDLMLHMHASMRANLASLCVRADTRLGFDRARARDQQWLFTNTRIAARPRRHVMDGLFEFSEALGIESRDRRWDIPLSDADHAFAARLTGDGRPVVVVSPCSSQRFRNFRNWSVERYAAVATHAAQRYGAVTVVTGGTTALEAEYGRRIETQTQGRVVNAVGRTTLKQLLAVLQAADVLICPDSGPAHMATAVNTPVVGLYATSNRFRTGPYLSQDLVVDAYPDAVAQEFGKPVAEIPWGARVRNPAAMSLIRVEDVTARLDSVLAATSSGST